MIVLTATADNSANCATLPVRSVVSLASDHAVPTAAVYCVRELRYTLYLQHTTNSHFHFLIIVYCARQNRYISVLADYVEQ
jgi:hypothetical protein